MDLSERRGQLEHRHPWETARLEAVTHLVAGLGLHHARTLDVGAGDGFVLGELCQRFRFAEAVAQDIHLTEALTLELRAPGIEWVRTLDQLGSRRFDLVLLLDVLEHLKDPVALLSRLKAQHLTEGGWCVITVPAFPGLFSEHDRQLKHFRRYTRAELERQVGEAGLALRDSGYLFGSLLLPRALGVLKERVLGPSPTAAGVGTWSSPDWVTRALHAGLCFDNRVCLQARRLGVTVPGLSVWVRCNAP